jgi:cellulose synthase/poly-beta-1,6-N-acetylglucosamine synthase-like glycosyltransferase
MIDSTIIALENQDFDRTRYEVLVVGIDKFGLIKESDLVRFDRSEQPLSPAEARNRGASQTEGEFIVFTDADCIPDPEWLRVFAKCFRDPNINVIGGGVRFGQSNYWTLADNVTMFYNYLDILTAGKRDLLPSLNLAIRRETFTDIGGFDERYPKAAGEDSDLCIRLRNAGHELYFEPQARVVHEPPRNRFSDVLRHSYKQGQYSTKLDPRYAEQVDLPRWLRHPLALILFAPILAFGAFYNVFRNTKVLWQYWYTAPVIYLSKLAWCWGAANTRTNSLVSKHKE